MALACRNVASYVDYIPPSAPPLTHSLICDACVCPTTCFARWNGSKSSVRVKWFSCVSFTLVRYMLSPTELLIFMSSTLCYVVALFPQASTLFTDKPYWRKKKKSNKTSIVSIMSLCDPRVVIIRFRKKHPPTLIRCVMVWIAEDFVDKFTRNLVRCLFIQPRSILQQLTMFICISSMKLCRLPAYTGYEMN